jgi:hypothetical protein
VEQQQHDDQPGRQALAATIAWTTKNKVKSKCVSQTVATWAASHEQVNRIYLCMLWCGRGQSGGGSCATGIMEARRASPRIYIFVVALLGVHQFRCGGLQHQETSK